MTTKPKITVKITIECEMESEWIWPSNNVPAEITEEAVREAMIETVRPLSRQLDGPAIVELAQEWNLHTDAGRPCLRQRKSCF